MSKEKTTEIAVEELRKRSLFIGMPMYGGQMSGFTCKALIDLANLCNQYGVKFNFFSIINESLITRARNYVVDEFLRSDFTHLMFIDSDIEFNANDVLAMLAHSEPNSDKDILCAPYPKKNISWEKVKRAVDKGLADENPNVLEHVTGDYVFNPVSSGSIPLYEPVEVLEGGTGFMLIQRNVFEKYEKAYPHLKYLPDHVRSDNFDGTREIMCYFDTVIDPDSRRYLSEDYMFCIPGDSHITTENGILSMKHIVDTKYSGKVLSLDENGNFVWNRVVNWVENDNKKYGKKWVKINTTTDNNAKAKLKCTDDHKVAYFDDIIDPNILYTEAKNLFGKYIIRKVDDRKIHRENALYNREQVSFMIGTLIGDGHVSGNGVLSFSHGEQQKEYIELKSALFGGSIKKVNGRGFGKGKVQYNLYCPINAHTHYMRELFYENGVKTIRNVIPYIDEKALAFWFCDDGYYSDTGTVISTNSFTYDDNVLIRDMFKNKWDIECEIFKKSVKYKNTQREYFELRFRVSEAKKMFELISTYVPKSMDYKLPVEYRTTEYSYNTQRLDYAASKVKEVVYLPKMRSKLYDIEVENTHNFVANGTVVHNCQYARKAGMKVWLLPWINLNHIGSYKFVGNLPMLANIGASATADFDEIKGKKKR